MYAGVLVKGREIGVPIQIRNSSTEVVARGEEKGAEVLDQAAPRQSKKIVDENVDEESEIGIPEIESPKRPA